MQNLAFSEVSDVPFRNSNVNIGTEAFAADLLFTWSTQELGVCFRWMFMINSTGFPYNCGNKFQLMLLLSDEFNKRTDFLWYNI